METVDLPQTQPHKRRRYGYSLFASKFMGFAQPQLSATFSAGAAITILTQLVIFPRVIRRFGEYATNALVSSKGRN